MNKLYILPLFALLIGCTTSLSKPYSVSGIGPKSSKVLIDRTNLKIRNDYMCRILTSDYAWAGPQGLDGAMRGYLAGVVDFYGDGTIEEISSYVDVAHKSVLPGNRTRSLTGASPMIFSPEKNFIVPNIPTEVGGSVSQADFNADGIDDLAIAQFGPDYPPYNGTDKKGAYPNRVLLSSPGGYVSKDLPGNGGHRGATGDIDNDGDVDFVATPVGPKRQLVVYLNDGLGNFDPRVLYSVNWDDKARPAIYNVFLWDFDEDGYLDLLLDGDVFQLSIWWGSQTGFNQKTQLDFKAAQAQDIQIGDFDGDSKKEIMVLASLALKEGGKHYYEGWGIYKFDFISRQISSKHTVYEQMGPHFWFPNFYACDLKSNGHLDLVIAPAFRGELYGDTTWNPLAGVQRIVFENDGAGSFMGHLFRNPAWMPERISSKYCGNNCLSAEESKMKLKSLGLSINPYIPAQKYFTDGTPGFERMESRFISKRPLYEQLKVNKN